jgi:hypothetical protein
MLRDPRTSLPSTLRALGYVDQEKLNATDGMIFTGRNYWLTCQPQLETLDRLSECLREATVGAFRLESLREHHEPTMRSVAKWLDVDFSDSMLESTFEGKLWWGDVTNEVRVNGLDPQSEPDRWRKSLSKVDTFATEGVCFNHFSKYGYETSEYRRDSALNRLLLVPAVLVPSKAELRTWGFYLNPLTHIRFLRAAVAESTGRAPRKDYTWNGTYRYKYTYIDLKLWRLRWHQRLLNRTEAPAVGDDRRWATGLIAGLGCGAYVAGQYGRFWLATLTYPLQIVRRWGIYYRSLWRRLSGSDYLPPLLPDSKPS